MKIVKSLGVNKVIFLPDDYLAKYVASQTDIEIISWKVFALFMINLMKMK